MSQHLLACLIFGLALPMQTSAQTALPPRLEDLPRLAAAWPPAWAALVHEVVPARANFENDLLKKLNSLLQAKEPNKADFARAEIVLSAALRHRQSLRQTPPLADDPDQALQAELHDRLAALRKDWLNHLRTTGDTADALSLADTWLPTSPRTGPVRAPILQLWIEQATNALAKMDYATARSWLTRIEVNYEAVAEPVSTALRERAETLFKEAQAQPDAQAIRTLEEALALWPRLPDARDALERKKGKFRTLVVGVPSLPVQLSPATASTIVEKQALELLFDRLYRVEHAAPGNRYVPQVAEMLPGGALNASIPLRRDVFWSNGDRLTAVDFRHTTLLTNQSDAAHRSALWRDYLEIPRVEGSRFHLEIPFRQGLLDPLAPLSFHVLPQMVRGKQLDRADDSDFAKAPVGSGPFQYAGRKVEGIKTYAVFSANPHDLRGGARSLREIRMVAWADPRKDLVKPLPSLILDAPTDQLSALKDLGYTEVRLRDNPCVNYLAINQRKPTLASVTLRRAIAHAIDRQDLLNRHFRAVGQEKRHASANGLFPRDSWAACPAPRVPEELYQAEQARSFARQAKKDVESVTWTLKYPLGDTRVKKACEEIAGTIGAVLREAGVKADVQALGLSSGDLHKALNERDYDLAYTSAEGLDDPVRLALFFDPQPSATRAGGSNLLGVDSDIKLQELLHGALKHRQFSVAQANLHAVHAQLYETMPAIPLWQIETHVLVQPTLRLPTQESPELFGRVREWVVMP